MAEEMFDELKRLVKGLEDKVQFLETELLRKQLVVNSLLLQRGDVGSSIAEDWELIEEEEKILSVEHLLGLENKRSDHAILDEFGCFWIGGDDRLYATKHLLRLNNPQIGQTIADDSSHSLEIDNKYYVAKVNVVCSSQPPKNAKNLQAAMLTFRDRFDVNVANYFVGEIDKSKMEALLCLLVNPDADVNNFSGAIEWCMDNGFELVESCRVEGEKMGIERVSEAIGAVRWLGMKMKERKKEEKKSSEYFEFSKESEVKPTLEEEDALVELMNRMKAVRERAMGGNSNNLSDEERRNAAAQLANEMLSFLKLEDEEDEQD